jgi:putative transposase
MARLPRLLIDGLPHLISLRAQHGQAMLRDATDRQGLLGLLRESAAVQRVSLQGWSVQESRLDLVATAASGKSLSLMMQALARRHAAAFNRRHERRGSLWEGRFRAAVIEPGPWLLRGMVHVDLLAGPDPAEAAERGSSGSSNVASVSSWVVHVGGLRDALFQAPDVYWALGNTPFDREAAYLGLLREGLSAQEMHAFESALRGGWPVGSAAFAEALAGVADRPTQPRPRGRPRRSLLLP